MRPGQREKHGDAGRQRGQIKEIKRRRETERAVRWAQASVQAPHTLAPCCRQRHVYRRAPDHTDLLTPHPHSHSHPHSHTLTPTPTQSHSHTLTVTPTPTLTLTHSHPHSSLQALGAQGAPLRLTQARPLPLGPRTCPGVCIHRPHRSPAMCPRPASGVPSGRWAHALRSGKAPHTHSAGAQGHRSAGSWERPSEPWVRAGGLSAGGGRAARGPTCTSGVRPLRSLGSPRPSTLCAGTVLARAGLQASGRNPQACLGPEHGAGRRASAQGSREVLGPRGTGTPAPGLSPGAGAGPRSRG